MTSHDGRAITLFVATCFCGLVIIHPSITLVRVAFVVLATFGVAMYVLADHNATASSRRMDNSVTTALFTPPHDDSESRVTPAPFASLIHPEVAAAIASLSTLSRPGRRAAVREVALTTENVVRGYHAILSMHGSRRASACIDDLRLRTNVALDALQCLRMETGSRGRAANIAVDAERRLRNLFIRFRQIACNKLLSPNLDGPPFPVDPSDDHRFLR